MRKRVFGRRLSRDTGERKALFRSLATALVTHGQIDTTEAKAKAVRPWVEKLVTRSKNSDLSTRRLLLSDLPNPELVNRLIKSVGPTFAARPGGYTRITRLGYRAGDDATIVRLEFVEKIKEVKATPKAKRAVKAEAKRPVRKPAARKTTQPSKTSRSRK